LALLAVALGAASSVDRAPAGSETSGAQPRLRTALAFVPQTAWAAWPDPEHLVAWFYGLGDRWPTVSPPASHDPPSRRWLTARALGPPPAALAGQAPEPRPLSETLVPALPPFKEHAEALAGFVADLVAASELHRQVKMVSRVIGHSQRGRDLTLVTVSRRGAPAPTTVMVVARQHGNEPAGSYGLLQLLRLWLTTRDPGLLDLLRQVTLCAVPVANPDGADAFERGTACGVNPNRDWLSQRLPENRALAAAIRECSPAVLLDLHEETPIDDQGSFAMVLPAGGAPWLLGAVGQALKANGYDTPTSDGGLRDARLLAPWFAVRFRRPGVMVESRWDRDPAANLERRAAMHRVVVAAALRAVAARSGAKG
jgi:hypothetical protein